MAINCPSTNESVKAQAGPPPAVCVTGTLEVAFVTSPPGSPPPAPANTVSVVVIVYAGHGVAVPRLPPAPPPPELITAVISGQDWCASDVPVSSAGNALPGDPMTAVAWQKSGLAVTHRHVIEFYTVDSAVAGATDCCADCVGSGSSGSEEPMEGDLSQAAGLEVAVPDGPNKGMHVARRVDGRTWGLMVGKEMLSVHHTRRGLLLRGEAAAHRARQVGRKPFSASFPGAALGAKGDVVVTVR